MAKYLVSISKKSMGEYLTLHVTMGYSLYYKIKIFVYI